MRIPVAASLLALVAAISPETSWAQNPANAADEYDRIAELLLGIDPGQDGPWSDPDGSSFTPFMQRGAVDARMRRWLDAARPLVGDLVRATSLPYDLALDRSQGFSLPLPHLARQRMIVRSLDVLLVDAQYGDRAACADILRAQAAIAGRAASDGLLISSLVAMGCGQMSRARLSEMINCGAIDAALAREALAATDPIDGRDSLRLGEALETEHAALALEIGKIAEAQGDDRARRIAELAGLMGDGAAAAPFTDEAIAAFPAQADAYRAAARAVVEAPTREAAIKAVAELSQAVGSGAYGEILKSFAPALDRVVERAWTYEEGWAALRADLTSLADGRKMPEDLMDAAFHYFRAAAAAQQIAGPDQAEFDALRLAGGFLDAETRAGGKLRLARLERAITAEVYRGSQLGRLRLDQTTLLGREITTNEGLVRATQPGINGAVRTMLAAAVTDDAVAKSPLEKPVAGAQELVVAAVRVAAHYATTGQYGHSLAALAMLHDAGDAIELLVRAGRFDADGKALLAKALGTLDGADPIGLTRATDDERRSLGHHFSDDARLARLTAVEVAALVAANAPPDRALDPVDCACPDHGAMLDMRRWFDADALAKAKASHGYLEVRREKARSADEGRIAGSPLEGVEIVPPFDLDGARESARLAVERLRRLAD